MGGRRPAPNIINTPSGPRRSREDSRDETRARFPRPRKPIRPRDIYRPVGAVDKEGNPVPGFDPRRKLSAPDTTERREETSGDSFERRRDRRMAGDRTGFFGRVKKMQGGGIFGSGLAMPTGRPTRGGRAGGFPTRGPAPDTRDRAPSEKTRKIFEAMREKGFGITINKRNPEYEERARKLREENDGKTISEIMREKRKKEGGFGLPASFYQNRSQNIAKTDI